MRTSALATVLTVLATLAGAQPLGTAFTYQGRLADAGTPANGTYDFQFVLMDAVAGGSQVGPLLTRDDVVVTNGLFTVSLDFGAAFAGNKRWLDAGVRPGTATGAYTTLSPRQELTPSPNAAFSLTTPWAGIANKPAGFADDVDNDSGGDITGVTAGTGLTGGGTTGPVTVSASLAGSGSATTLARSDHDHFSQAWSGSTTNGLTITNATGAALRGVTNGTAPDTTAILGVSTLTTGFGRGVQGRSGAPDGIGVMGEATSTTGVAVGVLGQSQAPNGNGVLGLAIGLSGPNHGVIGVSDSTAGRGVAGLATAASGGTYGVHGQASSTAGFGGFFENTSGGPALGVSAGGIRFSDGTTQTTAAVGDITGVTAGTGLTGGAATGNATLNVSFGGSGSSIQAARANHDHLGAFWNGPGGLYLSNTDPGLPGIWNQGLYVEAIGSQTRAVVGYATPTAGQNVGVWGQSDSTTGFGVLGYAPTTTGLNYGVYGRSDSPTGYAGFFEGSQVGIPNGKLTFGSTARQVIDLSNPFYGIGVQGGVVYFRTEPPGGMFSWFLGGSHSNMQNDPGPGGTRQMRLDGGGNLFVRGSVNPGGADFAEMLAAEPDLEPGDVLAIGPDGRLTLATTPYQESLAGVYSTRPGLVGGAADGESTDGKVPLAVAGVVPVKVTAENGLVRPGDLLTSSSTPGHAMRASRKSIVVGVVIGKALEPLDSETGVIRALVVLQ